MGRRGPLPEPSALKAAKGNPGKRQLVDGEPAPPSGVPNPPPWITPAGLEVWNQLAPALVVMKVLTVVDVFAFGRYCELTARWVELKKARDSRGLAGWSHKQSKNSIIVLPQGSEEKALMGELLRLEDHFGLTPSSRTRIRVQPSTPTNVAPPVVNDAEDKMAFFRRRRVPKNPPLAG